MARPNSPLWVGLLAIVALLIAGPLAWFGTVPWVVAIIVAVAAGSLTFFCKRWVALASVIMLVILFGSCHVTHKLTWVSYKSPVTFPPPAEYPILIVGTDSHRCV